MNVVLTAQSIDRLEEALTFYSEKLEIPEVKIIEIRDRLLERANDLSKFPYRGQPEPFLAKLGLGHRRLIEGNFKIIYRIDGDTVYVVDFFDTHNDPKKMKG